MARVGFTAAARLESPAQRSRRQRMAHEAGVSVAAYDALHEAIADERRRRRGPSAPAWVPRWCALAIGLTEREGPPDARVCVPVAAALQARDQLLAQLNAPTGRRGRRASLGDRYRRDLLDHGVAALFDRLRDEQGLRGRLLSEAVARVWRMTPAAVGHAVRRAHAAPARGYRSPHLVVGKPADPPETPSALAGALTRLAVKLEHEMDAGRASAAAAGHASRRRPSQL